MYYKRKLIKVTAIFIIIFILSAFRTLADLDRENLISQLMGHLKNKDTEFSFNYEVSYQNIDFEDINSLTEEAVSRADDYTAHTIKQWQINLKGNNREVEITYKVDYQNTSSEDLYVFDRTRGIINNIIRPSMNIHQKIKEIADYIAHNVVYDKYKQKYSAYDALQGSSTCQGYALLTYLMLKEAGIDNQIVVGETGGDSHAWNLVKLGGNWYHLDLTQLASYYHNYGEILYNEYLVNDSALEITHSWKHNDYPSADSSYFQQLRRELQYRDSKLYRQLISDLNLKYLEDSCTAFTKDVMIDRIENILAEKKEGIGLRVSKNLLDTNRISQIMNEIFSKDQDYTNTYKSWRFQTYPIYIRDGISDTGIVVFEFGKR